MRVRVCVCEWREVGHIEKAKATAKRNATKRERSQTMIPLPPCDCVCVCVCVHTHFCSGTVVVVSYAPVQTTCRQRCTQAANRGAEVVAVQRGSAVSLFDKAQAAQQ